MEKDLEFPGELCFVYLPCFQIYMYMCVCIYTHTYIFNFQSLNILEKLAI